MSEQNPQDPAAVPAGWSIGPASAPSPSVQTTITQMTEQMRTVIDAAERAAEAIRFDAEEQARRHLAEAQRKADRLTAERVGLISELTDDLIRHAANVRDHSERMVRALEEAINSVTDKLEQPAMTQPFSEPAAGVRSPEPGPAWIPPPPLPAQPAAPAPVPSPVPPATPPPAQEPAPAPRAPEPSDAAPAPDPHPYGTGSYTDIIGAPPPPPPATAPPPAPEHHHLESPAGAPQPTPEAAAEAAAHPGLQPEVPLDAVLYATRRAADGVDPAAISSELRLRFGVENPDPIVDRVMGRGEQRR